MNDYALTYREQSYKQVQLYLVEGPVEKSMFKILMSDELAFPQGLLKMHIIGSSHFSGFFRSLFL